jgi:hypothetical protein
MNRHRHARVLRLAVVSCVIVSWLLALHTPAQALVIYDALAQVSVLAPVPLPPGTGITPLSVAAANTVHFELGNAAASASISALPDTVSAIATGVVSGPGLSIARSDASALSSVGLFNQTPTTVLFPVTISHRLSAFTAEVPSSEKGGAGAQASFFVHFGAIQPLVSGGGSIGLCGVNDFEPPIQPECSVDDSGSTALLVPLQPFSGRSLSIQVFASGVASTPTLVPEPTTLVLFGTTAAALGLARWRRRRRT